MEIPTSPWIICLFSILVGCLVQFRKLVLRVDDTKHDVCYHAAGGRSALLVGVLSSRGNFESRKLLRSELKKQCALLNQTVSIYFIVADRPCSVPPEERVDEYTCSSVPHIAPVQGPFPAHHINIASPSEQLYGVVTIGIDFVVNRPVIVSKLGVYDHAQDGIKKQISVILYDSVSRDVIAEQDFRPGNDGVLDNGFRFKDIDNYILPKGFRGSVVTEGHSVDDPAVFVLVCDEIKTTGRMISFRQGYRYYEARGVFPDRHVNYGRVGSCVAAGTIVFSISGHAKVDDEERTIAYGQLLTEEAANLEEEQRIYGDLVVVDAVESYRELPQKMLMFYDWASRCADFDHLLKTDDDCFVNLPAIVEKLQRLKQHAVRNLWWGRFRRNWQLDTHGKWAELDYTAPAYPAFACGSGSVMSRDLIDWLSINKNYLHLFQGEDVSLSIWLSAIHPSIVDDHLWQCFRHCELGMLSFPDLGVSELAALYANHTACMDWV